MRGRAKIRIEKAMKEYEEEERQKRIGPGGLDPVDVYESLPEVGRRTVTPPEPFVFIPYFNYSDDIWSGSFFSVMQEMQKCFDDKDIEMLQEVISKMDPTVG